MYDGKFLYLNFEGSPDDSKGVIYFTEKVSTGSTEEAELKKLSAKHIFGPWYMYSQIIK